jgi:tetratricopeptide (TPR) repeat protein
MRNIMYLILLFLIYHFDTTVLAQSSAKQVRQGNKAFEQGNFEDAEILYRRALDTDLKWEKQALFNIGNSLYKQKKYNESADLFSKLSVNESLTDEEKAQVFHNLGNAYLMQEKYSESIDAYKKSLRINPVDENTRYNLSYAMKKIQQQQQQNQDNKENKDQKDNKEEQNQKDNKDQNDQKNQNDKSQDQQKPQDKDQKDNKDEQQQAKQQQQQISKQDMERMLNAISGKDKQTLEELREKQLQRTGYKPEKDW